MEEKSATTDDKLIDLIDFTVPLCTIGLRALIPSCDGYDHERDILTGKAASDECTKRTSEYEEVRRAFLASTSPEKHRELESSLELLRGVVKEMLAENDFAFDEDLVDSGTIILLKIFRASGDGYGDRERQKCNECFGMGGGQFPKLMHRAFGQISFIKFLLGRNFSPIIKRITGKAGRKRSGGFCVDGLPTLVENGFDPDAFGNDLGLIHPQEKDVINFENCVPKEWKEKFAGCEPEAKVAKGMKAGFSMKYNADSSASAALECSRIDDLDRKKFSLESVVEELSSQFGDTSDEILQSVFSWLTSDRSSDSLQNDLIDLLGLEQFTLISNILLNRSSLVDEYKSLVGVGNQRNMTAQEIRSKCRRKEPKSFGQQIVVQSEQEKRLAKELRKEDKKLGRMLEKRLNDPSSSVASQFVDVDVLRRRDLELEAARQMPLFFQRGTCETLKYPYVFDSQSSAMRSAAFIAGCKMALPDGCKRIDNLHFEEVVIEPNSLPPTNVGYEKKKIEDLDQLVQLAFKNTKALNLIQSVVFDKAYGSNDNLLICAPTGAGKTNIAMLCVLRVLKAYLDGGVIQKEKFKIIYVAPMKALAVEMVRNFSNRLEPFGIRVRELTGDTQLTKQEIMETQMLIATPEKWDVITRKSTGDTSLSHLVKLLIIDEVHLLHDDRGPVIETLVARTLRQEAVTQSKVRIVGLSATLPNYVDVARFLQVNPMDGLFFFDGRFRPVPLGLDFVGAKGHNTFEVNETIDKICFDKVLHFVKEGHQVMVFVHARMATGRVAKTLKEMASNKHVSQAFMPESTPSYGLAQKQVSRSRNNQLKELFEAGFGIHHAGMLRQDRIMVERLFSEGHIRVLCCTATLAWGVNLPAHAVIIRGTEIYDAKHGSYVDIGMLDVQQIFGRAGRPQFDKVGYGTILTSHDKLSHYLSLLTRQLPIESQFKDHLGDNLNAEICLGTVTNVREAIEWLSYTYLHVRMRLNPLVYGLTYKQIQDDPMLEEYRRELIEAAALQLDYKKMIRYNKSLGTFHPIDFGRIASHYYIRSSTVEVVNEMLRPEMGDDEVLAMVARATEFQELKIRDDEMLELDGLFTSCRVPVAGGVENVNGKVNVLLQAHISQFPITGFSLISDTAYVVQNAGRILRAVFEMALSFNFAPAAMALSRMAVAVETRCWPNDSPLWQLHPQLLRFEALCKIRDKHLRLYQLKEMSADEIGNMLRENGHTIKEAISKLPSLDIQFRVQPITRTVLKVTLDIVPDFVWDDRVHGRGNEHFHIWVLDSDDSFIHHKEYFAVTRRQVSRKEVQKLTFTVPLKDPLPSHYVLQWLSDRWLGCEDIQAIPLADLILPDLHPPQTKLLDLTPLPVTALGDERLQSLYTFTHYNAVQTQMFFCLYHTDNNVLIGAPTGSGKTIMAELAMFRMFRLQPNAKCVYVAPLKALVQERMKDWKLRLEGIFKKRVVELTGDVTPDMQAIIGADVIVTTPEKWDGISRSWQTRTYVRDVALIVIDEIHLLGEERGPVLEVIVSRTNFITAQTGTKVRIVGLSTALANAKDLADWLAIGQMGLYNFSQSVRPVPLEVHIRGFPDKRYCPRMASMNKPLFQEIKAHSPEKPVLVFVASRKQTRLTAFDLIALLAGDNPKQYVHMPESEFDQIIHAVHDPNLQTTLGFGIGMHHAGLHESDRRIVEDLFVNRKIQVLVATATLAWGVNFPAHLVVIKGTEYYDAKVRRYVDFPITDVLQMMGRAGRQQFDDHGVACIFVQDVKKAFYKKFLYEPFPVESNLPAVLADHLNAEIVAGTILSKQAAIDYLTWTFFFRRLLYNPSYYHLEGTNEGNINQYLSGIVDQNLDMLVQASCIDIMDDNRTIQPMVLGRIASFYYLQHKTVKTFKDRLTFHSSVEDLFKVLTQVPEYDEIPVRHNEDLINAELAKSCPLPCDGAFDSPHTKAHLLYQAHFGRLQLNSEFTTDLKSVLDQGIRILQAMLDVCADAGWLAASLGVTYLIQMVVQGRWITDPPLSILPHMDPTTFTYLKHGNRVIETVPELQSLCLENRDAMLQLCSGVLAPNEQEDVYRVLSELPIVNVKASLSGWWLGEKVEKRLVLDLTGGPELSYHVHADQQYLLTIDLARMNRKLESRAYAPKFPKVKDEGWFLILGDAKNLELVALKRVGFVKRSASVNLVFTTPHEIGCRLYELYLISDSYIGLDQQYELRLEIIDPSIEAQVNSELSIE